MPPLNLYARVHFVLCTSHTRPRGPRAPAMPCALSDRGRGLSAKLGPIVSRECEHTSSCHPVFPETPMIESRSRRGARAQNRSLPGLTRRHVHQFLPVENPNCLGAVEIAFPGGN